MCRNSRMCQLTCAIWAAFMGCLAHWPADEILASWKCLHRDPVAQDSHCARGSARNTSPFVPPGRLPVSGAGAASLPQHWGLGPLCPGAPHVDSRRGENPIYGVRARSIDLVPLSSAAVRGSDCGALTAAKFVKEAGVSICRPGCCHNTSGIDGPPFGCCSLLRSRHGSRKFL